MTADITTDNVARMLEGVTEGPWKCCETTIHGRKYGGCWVEGPDVDEGDGMPRGLLIPISGSGGAKSYTTRLLDIQDHDHNDANARFIAYAREAVPALAARVAELEAERDDPESNDAWCAGNQFALDRLCHVLKVDPAAVDWDGSDGSLTEEVDSLIWRIVHAHTEAAEAKLAALIPEVKP